MYIITALDNDPGHDEPGAYGSAYTSILVYGPGQEPEGTRNVRLTLDTRFIRQLEWDAPWDPWLSTVRTARAGSGPQQVVTDPWTTGYRMERREYRRTEDGGWTLPDFDEDEHIWSATITVGENSGATQRGYRETLYGALTQAGFTLSSGSYRVASLYLPAAGGWVKLLVSPEAPGDAVEDWVLVIDGVPLPLEDGDIYSSDSIVLVTWLGQSLTWNVGQQVSVRLVERGRNGWEALRYGAVADAGTSFTDAEDKGDRQYVYRVWPYNKRGLTHYSFRGDWAFNGGDPGGYPEEAEYVPPPPAQQQVGETPSNNSATGGPAISGTPQVGETLTASTSGIADADGLTNVSYSYQWLAGGSDIAGATGSTYTLTAGEQGKTVQVRVTFTDDADNEETLTSEATAEVTAAPEPLTASLPDSRFQSPRHLGADDRPQVIVAFSMAVASFEKTTPSLSLTGAAVRSVRQREEDGLDNAWIFILDPDGNDDIVFSLVTGRPCDSGGICTEDGTTLYGGVQVTLPGPDEEGEPETPPQEEAGDDQQTPESPPPAPTSLTATVNADGHIVLSWRAPNDDSITGYQVLRRRPCQGESALLVYVADTESTATTFTDTGVAAGVKHVYRVKAINAAGLSGWSNYVNPTP